MEITKVEGEAAQKEAYQIYSELQAFRGRASLEGFLDGEVVYPSPESRRIEVSRFNITNEFERNLMRERGFSDEDISPGIMIIIETEFKNPDWPAAPYIPEKNLRYFNINGIGKVSVCKYENDKVEFQPGELERIHVDALSTVIKLSRIPRQILDKFGSYDKFLKALGSTYKPEGIDTTEFTPTMILYNGGLREFVRGLELRASGNLGELDTSSHRLKDSLDDRDHFAKLQETLSSLT